MGRQLKGTISIKFENLRAFACAMESLAEDFRLHVDKKILQSKSVDVQNVAYISASTEIEFTGTPFVIGVSAYSIKNVVKSMELLGVVSDAVIKITIHGVEECSVLVFAQETGKSHAFAIEGFNADNCRKDPVVNEKQFEHPASADFNGADLISAVAACSIFSDRCRFMLSDGKFHIASKEEPQQCKIDMNANFVEHNVPTAALFSLDYIKDVARIFRKSTVHMNLGTDLPVTLSGMVSSVNVKFILAPRVDSESCSAAEMTGWL